MLGLLGISITFLFKLGIVTSAARALGKSPQIKSPNNILLAKSISSCGDAEEAQCILQELLMKCRSVEEKVPVNDILLVRSEFCQLSLFVEGLLFCL